MGMDEKTVSLVCPLKVFTNENEGDLVLKLRTMKSFGVILSVCASKFVVILISLDVWSATDITNLSFDSFYNDGCGNRDRITEFADEGTNFIYFSLLDVYI